jgi:nitrogen regulatory protein PII
MRRQRILSKMKRIEIVVEKQRLDALLSVIEANATGYTLVPGATGLGEHGYCEHDRVVVVTVVTDDHLDAIIDAILPTLNERAAIVLISDVSVLRAEKFIPEVRAATLRGDVRTTFLHGKT